MHSIEKFVQKCQPDYKLAGLYVIDSILRASLKPTAKEKAPTTSVYVRRFEEKLENIFTNLVQANLKDRVINDFQQVKPFHFLLIQDILNLNRF